MVFSHVPLCHGVHDERPDGGGLALAVPGIGQHDAGVGMIVEENRDQTSQ